VPAESPAAVDRMAGSSSRNAFPHILIGGAG